MLFKDNMLNTWSKKLISYTVTDLEIKKYIQSYKICRATKKNIKQFKNEMTQAVLKDLIDYHSTNEYFGIKYSYKVVENDRGIYIKTIETPLNKNSILLAK